MKRLLIFLTFIIVISINSVGHSSTHAISGIQNNFYEDNPVPAIVIEEEVEISEDPAWTYRFLIPISVAIATLVIVGNVIQYFLILLFEFFLSSNK